MKWLFILLGLALTACSTPIQRYEYVPDIEPVYTPPPQYKKGLIVIDPGHGASDDGTKSKTQPVYTEKHFNLSTARLLSEFLQQLGYDTQLTRNDDTFIPLKRRASFANNLRPLLFISVHYNSAPSSDAQGIEVFYYNSKTNQKRTETSRTLAQKVLAEVLANTQAKSRGVKHGNYHVIRETNMPAILIEGGFLTNKEELEKIKDPSYIKRIAWGIAQGVDKFVLGAS